MAFAGVLQEVDLGVARPPWETTPHGVVSLLDMMRFYADMFVNNLWKIHHMEGQWAHGKLDALIPFPNAVIADVGALQLDCVEHALTNTAQKCGRIMQQCSGAQPVTYRDAVNLLKELRERLEDELHGHLFLHLSPEQAHWHEYPEDQWLDVLIKFPRIRHDVIESSKCFSMERYAAAVFHILLIAEFGVIEVAREFGVSGDRPGWGALERLEAIHDKKWSAKTPYEQEHSEFLKNLLPLAFAMKNSWRHKISHIENKLEWIDTDFSQEVASEILSATRGFMRRLALDLPKERP